MKTGHSIFYSYRILEVYNSGNSVSYLLEIRFMFFFILPPLEFFNISFNHFEKRLAWKTLLSWGAKSFAKHFTIDYNNEKRKVAKNI